MENLKLKNSLLIIFLFLIVISLSLFYYTSILERGPYGRDLRVSIQERPTAIAFEPSSLTWLLATSSAEWEPRDSAASFVFQNKMWMMGGLNGNQNINIDHTIKYWEAPHFNDIWSSEDGITWKPEKEHAEWPSRRSMSVVNFQGKLWMFGGWSPISGYASDIWQSTDGINWTEIVATSSFPVREGQTADVFNGKIWITGGVNYDERVTKNDVWWSDNGIDWHEATEKAPWSSRWDHATAVFNGKIFLSGGMELGGKMFNDVWSTSDGVNWELVTASAPWKERQGHSMVTFHDKMWLVGILSDAEGGSVNDVWYTSDGLSWEKTLTNPAWLGREDHSVLVYKDKIFVFQGMNSNWKWTSDVWFSTDRQNVSELTLGAGSFFSVYVSKNGEEKILVEKEKNKKLPIASITKLMTALVAMEQYKVDDIITISKDSLLVKGISGIYHVGDSFLFSDALRTMLIASHNELASAIAEKTGTVTFVDLMNKMTSDINLSNTKFINPIGTDPDTEQGEINHSTSFDLYKLARYIKENNQDILAITTMKEFRLLNSGGKFVADVKTTDKLLDQKDLPFNIIGGKTGETPRAKKNLVVVVDSPCGGNIYGVVLGSDDNFDDMKKLLQYVNNSFVWSCEI